MTGHVSQTTGEQYVFRISLIDARVTLKQLMVLLICQVMPQSINQMGPD